MDGTRRRLWEAALTCFGERGYHGVSVREIAKMAGLQAGSVYSHVSSKEQLLADLMPLGHEEHRDMLRGAPRAGDYAFSGLIMRIREVVGRPSAS